MGQPLKVAIQAGTPLGNGCTVEFVALDPTDGSEVTGVTVTNSSIYFEGGPGDLALMTGPFMGVPGPGA